MWIMVLVKEVSLAHNVFYLTIDNGLVDISFSLLFIKFTDNWL